MDAISTENAFIKQTTEGKIQCQLITPNQTQWLISQFKLSITSKVP